MVYHTFCLEQVDDDEAGRPQPLPRELCCQCLPDGLLLHLVVDHLKLNFLVDYPAHEDIKYAGEALENYLEHEDHYLLSIGLRRALVKEASW